jgi:hypothetical protein
MAIENVRVNEPAASGTTRNVAVDTVSTTEYQVVKVMLGADGSATLLLASGQATGANSVPVVIASDQGALPAPNIAVAATAVTVTTTATKMPTTPLANRKEITVQNQDATLSLFVGPSGVTTASGIEIIPMGTLTLRLGPSVDLYGIVASGSINARALEVS